MPGGSDKAKAAATKAMELTGLPERIDIDEQREGIVFIDRLTPMAKAVTEDFGFNDDHIHGPPPSDP